MGFMEKLRCGEVGKLWKVIFKFLDFFGLLQLYLQDFEGMGFMLLCLNFKFWDLVKVVEFQ